MYHRPALVTKEFSYLHVALYKHCVRTFEDKQRNGTHCKDDLMASGICWLCCLGANYHTLYIDSKHPTKQVLQLIISSQQLNQILFKVKESSKWKSLAHKPFFILLVTFIKSINFFSLHHFSRGGFFLSWNIFNVFTVLTISHHIL